MVQSCNSRAVELVPGKQENRAISAPTLPRERELSFAHAHRCSFLIIELCCMHLAVAMIPGITVISAPILPKSAKSQSGSCAEV
jgi:hypothetical protein